RASSFILGALLLAGCEDWVEAGSADRYKEDFHFSYPLSANGRVEVESFNGSVEISGWDQNTIDISGTKYANTPERDLARRASHNHTSPVEQFCRDSAAAGNPKLYLSPAGFLPNPCYNVSLN